MANTESKDIRIFDTITKTFANAIPLAGTPWSAVWSQDERALFVPMQSPDEIAVVDASTGSLLRHRAFGTDCEKPHEAVFSSDRSTLYVTCEGDHAGPSAILAIDPNTLETRTTLPVGVYPDRLAVLGLP